MTRRENTTERITGTAVFAVLCLFFVFSYIPLSTRSAGGNKNNHHTQQVRDRSSDAALISVAPEDVLVKQVSFLSSPDLSQHTSLRVFNSISFSSLSCYTRNQPEIIRSPLRISIFGQPSLHGDGLPA
jgi:hypothetical protein